MLEEVYIKTLLYAQWCFCSVFTRRFKCFRRDVYFPDLKPRSFWPSSRAGLRGERVFVCDFVAIGLEQTTHAGR